MDNIEYKIATTESDVLMCYTVRSIVFIEEQSCPFAEEFDGKDSTATHFLVTVDNEPAGTARIRHFKRTTKFERLAIRKLYRGHNIAKTLFQFALDHIKTTETEKVILHAQSYLIKFYESFGFCTEGNEFTEAGIPHYLMKKYQHHIAKE